MIKWWKIGVVLNLMWALLMTGCQEPAHEKPSGKTRVVASIYPLEYFAKMIGGEHVEVTALVPPGVEPHDFELSPRDMMMLGDADVFVYNGAGMEAWAEKALSSAGDDTVVVEATKGIPLLHPKGSDDGHDHDGEAHDRESGADPHVWLDPVRAKEMAGRIRDGLIRADAPHRNDYEQNFAELARRLDELHARYLDMTKKAPRKEFLVSHAAFSYLADRYGLKQIAVSGVSPSDEPGPRELADIVETARRLGVKAVLFETLVSGKVAETVRRELGAEALVLNPLEGLTEEEKARGADYFTVMEQNLSHLAKALGVQP
ncbi:metal ABC transporter substrate-binding protein [Staphylospora marina]|uniref:metal ABC transporter substrate-binding protein n=1 Tax=Staphylospora marina TaxID=2490858 RepID=UPI000F5B9B2F|nr:metal ABC transporter substrate-binding protein [Staphylospora marina]